MRETKQKRGPKSFKVTKIALSVSLSLFFQNPFFFLFLSFYHYSTSTTTTTFSSLLSSHLISFPFIVSTT